MYARAVKSKSVSEAIQRLLPKRELVFRINNHKWRFNMEERKTFWEVLLSFILMNALSSLTRRKQLKLNAVRSLMTHIATPILGKTCPEATV